MANILRSSGSINNIVCGAAPLNIYCRRAHVAKPSRTRCAPPFVRLGICAHCYQLVYTQPVWYWWLPKYAHNRFERRGFLGPKRRATTSTTTKNTDGSPVSRVRITRKDTLQSITRVISLALWRWQRVGCTKKVPTYCSIERNYYINLDTMNGCVLCA